MINHLSTTYWGTKNYSEFVAGIQQCINNLEPQTGIYTGDNLFTYQRNLSFLTDEPLMSAWMRNADNNVEHAILWRTAILLGAARNGLKLEGDFVECGCYKGTTVKILCDAVGFSSIPKKYYIYDLFEHDLSMPHHAMAEHGRELYDKVKIRFQDMDNVIVSKGKIPDILHETAPAKISFMHIDMNNAEAEIGALELLWDRMVAGAVLILDDYGWIAYKNQKIAEDAWFQKRGFHIMELPTGQGMLIKQ